MVGKVGDTVLVIRLFAAFEPKLNLPTMEMTPRLMELFFLAVTLLVISPISPIKQIIPTYSNPLEDLVTSLINDTK